MTLDKLPSWLQHELTHQVPIGGRNNHAMKIAPALLREGMPAHEVFAALAALYPNAKSGELEGVVERAQGYAQTEREQDPEYLANKARRDGLRERAQMALPRIISGYQMDDIDSTVCELPLPEQRRMFIDHMFDLEDVIWIGDTQQSGPRFRHHFKTARTWLARRSDIPGEFITHSTFQPGTVNRNGESIAKRKYMVLESDLLAPSALAAVARYLRDYHGLLLRAIVTTGGKRHAPAPGLHFWFNYPGDSVIEDWAAVLSGYEADVSTLRGPQPVRLCGCVRKDTGLPQELWWIA